MHTLLVILTQAAILLELRKTQYHWVTEYNDVFCVLCDIFQSNLMAVRDFSFTFAFSHFMAQQELSKLFDYIFI